MKPIIMIEYSKSEYDLSLEIAKDSEEHADVDTDLYYEAANSVGMSPYADADYILLLTDGKGNRTGDTLCLKG